MFNFTSLALIPFLKFKCHSWLLTQLVPYIVNEPKAARGLFSQGPRPVSLLFSVLMGLSDTTFSRQKSGIIHITQPLYLTGRASFMGPGTREDTQSPAFLRVSCRRG